MSLTNTVPTWHLESIFSFINLDDPKFLAALNNFRSIAKELYTNFHGKLNEQLHLAILAYNHCSEEKHHLAGYTSCYLTPRQDDPIVLKRVANIETELAEIDSKYLAWFPLELNQLDSVILKKIMDTHDLKRFESYIFRCRKRAQYMLDIQVESALKIRSPWCGVTAVKSEYEKLLASARFFQKDSSQPMGITQVLTKFFHQNPKVRHEAAEILKDGLTRNRIDSFATFTLNFVAGSRAIEDKERGFENPRSYRNLISDISDDCVLNLVTAVIEECIPIGKRYYNLKKKILKSQAGIDNNFDFTWADRNAPVILGNASDRRYTWNEAVEMITQAFASFSPAFKEGFDKLINEKRVDWAVSSSKRSGAACWSNTKRTGPTAYGTFEGHLQDVTTLAHESGHAIHFMYTYEQEFLQQTPPYAIMEIASTFAEMLVFDSLLQQTDNAESKATLLLKKIGDILNTVLRQISFDQFEYAVHTKRHEGPLDVEEMNEIWVNVTRKFYGDEGEVFDKYGPMENLWAYVQHFVEEPFYVYGYAFAQLFVDSLYCTYKAGKQRDFVERFEQLLRAGSSKDAQELMKLFNFECESPKFWKDAIFGNLGKMMDEAEKLISSLTE